LKFYGTTLVSLNIPIDEGIGIIDLLENIARLSNLSALKILTTPECNESDEYMWLKLTNLTNLYDCDWASDAPLSLVLPYWSNLTRLNHAGAERSDAVKEILQKFTKLRDVSIERTNYTPYNNVFDWNIPSAVTKLHLGSLDTIASFNNIKNYSQLKELFLSSADNSINRFPFSELLALQHLEVRYGPHKAMIDLSKNTNVTSLFVKRGNQSFSNLVKLRQLSIEMQRPATDNAFFSTLTDLERLGVDLQEEGSVDSQWLGSLNSSHLTYLSIFTRQQPNYRDLSRLTNLVELAIYEQKQFYESASSKINMGLLYNLTRLEMQTVFLEDFKDISRITSLKELRLEAMHGLVIQFPIKLSALTNLEMLNLIRIDVRGIETDLRLMKNLTDLIVRLNDHSDYSFLEVAPIKLFRNGLLIHSNDFWSSVARCTTLESLIHGCASPENYISSLTTLSRMTQLSLSYSGAISEEHLILLTSLRILELIPCIGGSRVSERVKTSMTWLEFLHSS
jgi:hypothetical protein